MPNAIIVSAETIRNIEFYDLDPMHIVWHGNYVKYFEEARCALLDKINYNYEQMDATGFLWPIVDLRVKYVDSVTFKQSVVIVANLVEYENRIKIEYLVKDSESNKILTKGETVQVAVCKRTKEMQFVSPDILIDKLQAYL